MARVSIKRASCQKLPKHFELSQFSLCSVQFLPAHSSVPSFPLKMLNRIEQGIFCLQNSMLCLASKTKSQNSLVLAACYQQKKSLSLRAQSSWIFTVKKCISAFVLQEQMAKIFPVEQVSLNLSCSRKEGGSHAEKWRTKKHEI